MEGDSKCDPTTNGALSREDCYPQTCTPRRLRVIVFTTQLGGGGAERHAVRIAAHLDPDMFASSVAVVRGGGAYRKEIPERVGVEVLLPRRIESATLSLAAASLPLTRFLRRERPDVLCAVMDHAGVLAALCTRRLPTPPALVVSVQNPPSAKYGRSARLANRVLAPAVRWAHRVADRIVALSEGVREELESSDPSLSGKVRTIYNAGIDDQVATLANEKVELPPIARPLLVACARLTPQKGLFYLLDALAKLRQRVPATLWLLGEGPLRGALEDRAASLGISDAVSFLGFRSNPFPYVAAADVFVLSSVFEGFGLVITEALALGIPVVATDCPYGPREILNDEQGGILVPSRDASALASGVLRVLSDRDLSARLADTGRARAQDFHARTVSTRYGELFLDVARAPSHPG